MSIKCSMDTHDVARPHAGTLLRCEGGDALTLAVWTGPEHMMLGDRSHMPGLPST